MKENNIKQLILVCVLSVCIGACTDLDENLYDSISADETQFTAADVKTIIAPAYAQLREVYWGWDGLFDVYEESSDLIVTPNRPGIGWGTYYVDFHKHVFGSQQSHVEALWARTYVGVIACNKAIFQVEAIDDVEGKENILAELRALRAFYYYLLLDNYRNVPILTKFDIPEGFLPEQSAGQEVYDFIETELLDALPLLSEENSLSTYGRFTAWAAKMTLAKLYLNSEAYIGTGRYDDALAQVEDVIASGEFSLLPSYSGNFVIDNTNTPEEIFSIPYGRPNHGPLSYYPFKTLYSASAPTYNMPAGWGGSCGIPQFIDTYDDDDSRLDESWLGGPQFSASGDPIMLDEDTQFEYVNYVTNVDDAKFYEGYRFIKYEIDIGFTTLPDADVPFYRYADALMIKAECLLRSGNADGAAEIVTDIRERAFKNEPAKAAVTGTDLMQGSIYQYGLYEEGVITNLQGGDDIEYGRFLDELAWEFVGEHHRKQDLIRFGVYTTKQWLSHTPNGDHYKLFPIPFSALQTNANLVQNPGYTN